jgi:hypothetical protein
VRFIRIKEITMPKLIITVACAAALLGLTLLAGFATQGAKVSQVAVLGQVSPSELTLLAKSLSIAQQHDTH